MRIFVLFVSLILRKAINKITNESESILLIANTIHYLII